MVVDSFSGGDVELFPPDELGRTSPLHNHQPPTPTPAIAIAIATLNVQFPLDFLKLCLLCIDRDSHTLI